jgi:hypothetical protein
MIKLRMMGLGGHIVRIGVMKNVYQVLAGKPEGKRQFRKPRSKGRVMLRWQIMYWICVTQDRGQWWTL